MKVRDVERQKELKLLFRDYPCFECPNWTSACDSNMDYCSRYKKWFIKTWAQIRKDLSKHVKHD